MNLSDAFITGSLFLIFISVAILIYYTIHWRVEIRKMHTQMLLIEKEFLQYQQPKFTQQSEADTDPNTISPEHKPTDTKSIQEYIQHYYPTFIENITRNNIEKFSNSEELLCMMIKMGYTNKEIGNILTITNSSVLTARYRLKRKLSLPPGQSLTDWIQTVR